MDCHTNAYVCSWASNYILFRMERDWCFTIYIKIMCCHKLIYCASIAIVINTKELHHQLFTKRHVAISTCVNYIFYLKQISSQLYKFYGVLWILWCLFAHKTLPKFICILLKQLDDVTKTNPQNHLSFPIAIHVNWNPIEIRLKIRLKRLVKSGKRKRLLLSLNK